MEVEETTEPIPTEDSPVNAATGRWDKYKNPKIRLTDVRLDEADTRESPSTGDRPPFDEQRWGKYRDPKYNPKADPESHQYDPETYAHKDESLWGKIGRFAKEHSHWKENTKKQASGFGNREGTNDQDILGIAGRVIGRGLAALGGAPGDIANLGIEGGGILNSLLHGKGFSRDPNVQDIKNLNPLPTSEQIRGAFGGEEEHHAKGTLGFMEDVGSLAAELGALGLSPKSAVKAGLAGNLGKKIAGWFGASEGTQEGVGLAAMGLASLRAPGQAKKFADGLMNEAVISTPAELLSGQVKLNLKHSVTQAQRSFKPTGSSRNAFKSVMKDLGRAQSLEDLVEIRRNANELYPAVKGTGGVDLHGNLVRGIDEAINDTAKGSPWLQEYKDAIQTQKIFHETRAAQDSLGNALKQLYKSPTAHALALALHWLPSSVVTGATFGGPALGAVVGSGLAARTVLNRIMKSPKLKEHYEKAFTAFLEKNTGATINGLTKLANALEEEEEEE